ncbi:hypothetical protein CDAR_572201 [Caerostris darwini]|uniref:Secreted protein n=1 Tax=Caerostris darwini TaxID=1538125 RepID=A0AAV4NTF1_9ARAC|nr:hypothetical protein CDAR_572201 [Caerostris darwini]
MSRILLLLPLSSLQLLKSDSPAPVGAAEERGVQKESLKRMYPSLARLKARLRFRSIVRRALIKSTLSASFTCLFSLSKKSFDPPFEEERHRPSLRTNDSAVVLGWP